MDFPTQVTMPNMTFAPFNWQSNFGKLGTTFTTHCPPTPLPAPYWVAKNEALRDVLALPEDFFRDESFLSAMAGNSLLEGSTPQASVYSGHQFGVWAGQLGDGRAISLGEIQTPQGIQDIQLKGAGPTPYSRRGDGRAVLRSSIREFLCSEAMFGLGIPTTRALCVTGSPAKVYREEIESAAVVARMSPSFVRFGHFEHFASVGNVDAVRTLLHHVVKTHLPFLIAAEQTDKQLAVALLKETTQRTAQLMADWQSVGFCHGVMNTDNMSMLGLTIDYGPFGFMDGFDPDHICNHSDDRGRYSWNNQPQIGYWNLRALAQALLPLLPGSPRDASGDVGESSEEGAQALTEVLRTYEQRFPDAMNARWRAKLGLQEERAEDVALAIDFLRLLAAGHVDFTIAFRRLCGFISEGDVATLAAGARNAPVRDLFLDRPAFDAWAQRYALRLQAEGSVDAERAQRMRRVNPVYVLRNHLAETAIRRAQQGDDSEVQRLHKVLQNPFDEQAGCEADADFPPSWAQSIEVSCSS